MYNQYVSEKNSVVNEHKSVETRKDENKRGKDGDAWIARVAAHVEQCSCLLTNRLEPCPVTVV